MRLHLSAEFYQTVALIRPLVLSATSSASATGTSMHTFFLRSQLQYTSERAQGVFKTLHTFLDSPVTWATVLQG